MVVLFNAPFSRGSVRGAGGAFLTGASRTGGRLHVEKHMFDVARLVEAHQTLGERFDLVF
jgi:hypothetical protein